MTFLLEVCNWACNSLILPVGVAHGKAIQKGGQSVAALLLEVSQRCGMLNSNMMMTKPMSEVEENSMDRSLIFFKPFKYASMLWHKLCSDKKL